MNYIISGAAGFLGSHLTERLLKDGHTVLAIDNNEDNIKRNLKETERLTILKMDVRDLRSKSFDGYEAIVHLAALADIVPSIENPNAYFTNNVDGTLSALEFARQSGIKKFIYAASSSCYGLAKQWPATEETPIQTMYPYAESKYLGERLVMHYAQVYKMACTSLRFFNIYGPRSRTTGGYGAVFTTFLAQKAKGLPYTIVGDGSQSRDFLFVTDAVASICAAIKSSHAGVFNIGSGHHYTVKYLVELLGYPRTTVHVPKRPGEPDMTLANIDKAQNLLDWSPSVNFTEGVGAMVQNIDYYKDAKAWTGKDIETATEKWFHYLKDDKPKQSTQFFPSIV